MQTFRHVPITDVARRLRPVLADWPESRRLPFVLLLLALSSVFLFGGDRGRFYRGGHHSDYSSIHLTIAANLSAADNFVMFERRTLHWDGTPSYEPYSRFPIGGYALMKLAMLPVGESLSARIYAARMLVLLFFSAAAILAYLSLCRLMFNRWVAAAATLLAFSSYYCLYYNDVTAPEVAIAMFGVLLTFHGMVIFEQEGRFRQLLARTCVALLLDWHVFALLLTFIVLAVARELKRAYAVARTGPALARSAVGLVRSRYVVLGFVAMTFGTSVLAFNFTREYVALDGRTPLTELPTFQSMLSRTGQNEDFNREHAEALAWPNFLENQIYRVGAMSIPAALPGYDVNDVGRGLQPPSGSQSVALGAVVSLATLIGLLFARWRLLLATVALVGCCWAMMVPGNVAFHAPEALFHIGIPLVFFALVLTRVRELSCDRLVAGTAAGALMVFVFSAFQMAQVDEVVSAQGQRPDTATPAFQRTAMADFETIRDLTRGRTVLLPVEFRQLSGVYHGAHFYLAGTTLVLETEFDAQDLVVMRGREGEQGLLTPDNEEVFLYDRSAWERRVDRLLAATEAGGRVIDADFDVYLNKNRLIFRKDDCSWWDTRNRFYVVVVPMDVNDLPDDGSRQRGSEVLDFMFDDRGLVRRNTCVATQPLPAYDISMIEAGQYDLWAVRFPGEAIAYDGRLDRILEAAGAPVVRSDVDVHLDGNRIIYVKRDCDRDYVDDPARLFFVHLVPTDVNDLEADRREAGFDSRDFGIRQRSWWIDGTCIAIQSLPTHYAIDYIRTGEVDPEDLSRRLWDVNFEPGDTASGDNR